MNSVAKENRKRLREREELKRHLLNVPLDSWGIETDTDENEDERKKRRLGQNRAEIENSARARSYAKDVQKLKKWRRRITKATLSAKKKQKKIRTKYRKSATFTEDDSDDSSEIANGARRRSYQKDQLQLEKCRFRISSSRRSAAKKQKKILEEYQESVKDEINIYLYKKDQLHNKYQKFSVSCEEELQFKEGDILVRKKNLFREIKELSAQKLSLESKPQTHFLYIHRASACTVTYSFLPSKPVAFCSESQWYLRHVHYPGGSPRYFACGHLVYPGVFIPRGVNCEPDCHYCSFQPLFAGPDENKVGVKKFRKGLRWTPDGVPCIEGPEKSGLYLLWSRSTGDSPLLTFPVDLTFHWHKKVVEEGLEWLTFLPTVLIDLIAEFTYHAGVETQSSC